MASTDAIAENFMSDAQRDALSQMTDAMQGLAIQSMAGLLIDTLHSPEETALQILESFSPSVSRLDLIDTREVTEHIIGLRRLLGRHPTAQLVSLPIEKTVAAAASLPNATRQPMALITDPKLDETGLDEENPATKEAEFSDDETETDPVSSEPDVSASANDEEDESLPELSESETEAEETAEVADHEIGFLRNQQLRTMIGFFGEENADLLSILNREQSSELVEALFILFEKYPVMRQGRLEERKQQLSAHIFTGKSLAELAEEMGHTHAALKHSFNHASDKLRKVTTSVQLREVIKAILIDFPNKGSDSAADNNDAPDEEAPALDPEAGSQAEILAAPYSRETDTTKSVFDRLGNLLHYSSEAEMKRLKAIFNVEQVQPDYSSEARVIYDDIDTLIQMITDNKSYSHLAQGLEFRIINALIHGSNDGKILAARSVQGKFGKELGEAKRKFREVIEAGLDLIVTTRQEMLREKLRV